MAVFISVAGQESIFAATAFDFTRLRAFGPGRVIGGHQPQIGGMPIRSALGRCPLRNFGQSAVRLPDGGMVSTRSFNAADGRDHLPGAMPVQSGAPVRPIHRRVACGFYLYSLLRRIERRIQERPHLPNDPPLIVVGKPHPAAVRVDPCDQFAVARSRCGLIPVSGDQRRPIRVDSLANPFLTERKRVPDGLFNPYRGTVGTGNFGAHHPVAGAIERFGLGFDP